jgi:hypothetical protein
MKSLVSKPPKAKPAKMTITELEDDEPQADMEFPDILLAAQQSEHIVARMK